MIALGFRRLFLLMILPCFMGTSAYAMDLTPEQEARFRAYMPRTFTKLQKRMPVHVVTIGDSVMNMYGYGDEYFNSLKAYQTVFLRELADHFYYPGGVRVIRPQNKHDDKLEDVIGLEITLQNLARGGKHMFHALQTLTTVAYENKPDLIMVSYGINDSFSRADLGKYRQSLEEIIASAKSQGADLLLFGPSLVVGDPAEEALAATRPYSDIMKETAEAHGVYYADLGDLSWLTQLDDRNKHLEKVRKDKLKEEAEAAKRAKEAADTQAATAAANAKSGVKDEVSRKDSNGNVIPDATTAPASETTVAAPVSPVVNPLIDQLDLDPEKKAVKLFNFIVEDYRKHFNHGETIDWIHPDADFHRILGRRLYKELLNGTPASPWSVKDTSLTLGGTGKCVLSYTLTNTTEEEQSISLLPLVLVDWKPQAAPTEIHLKPGKSTKVEVTYATKPGTIGGALPVSEALLRFPIIHGTKSMVRIDVVRAYIQPVTVVWDTGAAFNVEGSLTLKGTLINNSKAPFQGKWEASAFDQKWQADVNVPAGGEAPVELLFKTPTDATKRQKGTLKFTVSGSGFEQRFDRLLEMSRNIGLKEDVPLFPGGDYIQDIPYTKPMPTAENPGIVFKADADSKALYLTWDIIGINLLDNAKDAYAFVIETSLDARSYGKRLMHGSTDVVRITGLAADGDCRVGVIQPWAFGTGYAAYFNEKLVRAKLTSRPDGSRRVTLTLPRSYLYLHEWQLGNGNSQLGINSVIAFWQTNDSPLGGAYEIHSLTTNGFHRDDAETLCALELTDKPTNRWTVRVY